MVAICLCCRLYTLCPLQHQRTIRVYVRNPIEMFKPPPLTSARLSSAPRASTPARAWPACDRPFVQIIAHFNLFHNCSNYCTVVMRAILMRLLRFRVGKMLRKVGQQGARVAISEFNVCNLVIPPLLPSSHQTTVFSFLIQTCDMQHSERVTCDTSLTRASCRHLQRQLPHPSRSSALRPEKHGQRVRAAAAAAAAAPTASVGSSINRFCPHAFCLQF